jgi:hypothetical protein
MLQLTEPAYNPTDNVATAQSDINVESLNRREPSRFEKDD